MPLPVPGPRALEVGYELPSNLGQPNQPNGAHICAAPRMDVRPRGTLVPCPVAQENQTVGPWVRDPGLASSLSSFPATPESRPEGFIAEAWGTCQTANAVIVSQCVAGGSGPPSTQPSQASSASEEAKSKNPLFKLQKDDGSACLETFLLQFKHLATYLQWDEKDRFYHMCASLDGPAGHVLWELLTRATTADLEHLLHTAAGGKH